MMGVTIDCSRNNQMTCMSMLRNDMEKIVAFDVFVLSHIQLTVNMGGM